MTISQINVTKVSLVIFISFLFIIIGLLSFNIDKALAQSFSEDKLQASNRKAGARLGRPAIDDEVAIVGAFGEDSGAGAAYIFTKSNGVWSQHSRLEAEDRQPGDAFGLSVAIDGDTAIIGAAGEDFGENVSGYETGAAYIFTKSNGVWSQHSKLRAEDKQQGDQFGNSVAIDGDTVAIGAHNEDTGAGNAGAVYVFTLSDDTWSQHSKLQSEDREEDSSFSYYSLAMNRNNIVVGARSENNSTGAAYVFTKTNGVWSQHSRLEAEDKQSGDLFGNSVDIDRDNIIIGAWGEDTGADDAGAAYVFTFNHSSNTWSQHSKLQSSDIQQGSLFGLSVAIDGDMVVVGAEGESTSARDAGAAYVFTFNHSSSTWSHHSKLEAFDKQTDDSFGYAVAVDGEDIFIGANNEDTGADNAGAVYTFSVVDCSELPESPTETELQSSDTESGDWFGYSVAMDGDVAVVGAPNEGSGNNIDIGAAYVFTKNNGTWSEHSKLESPDGQIVDQFGKSVAIDGETIVVGAPGEDTGATNAGAAYVFTLSDDAWSYHSKIQAEDKQTADFFGEAVAVSGGTSGGETIVVGAPNEDTGGSNSGAIYIFTQNDNGTWTQDYKFQADDNQQDDLFGSSVAIDVSVIVVGAWQEDTGANNAGAAYIFTHKDGVWAQYAKLQADDREQNDQFGFSVDTDGNTIIVGAPGEDTGANNAGAAYVFTKDFLTWSQRSVLRADDKQQGDRFGYSVALDGYVAAVGAPGEDIEDTEADDANTDAAYMFIRNDNTWSQHSKFEASDNQIGDTFGISVAIDGDTVIVGASDEDINDDGGGELYTFTSLYCNQLPVLPDAVLEVQTYDIISQDLSDWTTDDIDIRTLHNGGVKHEVSLRWSSEYAESCSGSGSDFSTGTTVSGIDHFIGEPSAGNSETYTLTCTADYGAVTTESITVTNLDPVAILEQRVGDDGVWSADDVTIEPDDEVELRWSSINAHTCVASTIGYRYSPDTYFSIDGGFETGTDNSATGTDYDIIEPVLDRDTIYTVSCSGGYGTTSANLTVKTRAMPAVTLEQRIYNGTWSSDDVTIADGDVVHLRWTSTNATSCTGTGPDFGVFSTNGIDFLVTEPTAGNSSTFTVTCSNLSGTASDSIIVTND